MKRIGKIFYKPNTLKTSVDILSCLIAIVIAVIWRYSAAKSHIWNYLYVFTVISLLWIFISYILGKYKKKSDYSFIRELVVISISAVVVFVFLHFAIKYFWLQLPITSYYVITTMLIITITINYIFSLTYKFYRYATNMDEILPQVESRQESPVLKKSKKIDIEELNAIKNEIKTYTDSITLDFIERHIDLSSSNTKVIASTTLFNFNTIRKYRYDAIINLAKLNSIRGINRIFNKINDHLPDNALFCVCYESISQLHNRINRKYHPIIRPFVQAYYFITKRVLPKLLLTNRLYFDITKGKNRYFSDTEVLGRLYYCGFEVINEYQTSKLNWIIARRATRPHPLIHKRYGIIIKLPRVCKNREIKPVYKMRTMYPYAEYIQSYIQAKAGSDDIGKIKNDIRVTSWGRFFRKFWIDELPMIWNLLKGDLKIVGVRPLSLANFSRYPAYLQEKRTKIKPGLIPPMYYDLPKTEQDFYNSEELYIDSYLKSPIKTDFIYFFKAFYNIIIKKARSH